MSVPAAITIVGLGPGGPEMRTVACQRALDTATRIFLRTTAASEISDLTADERVVVCNNTADIAASDAELSDSFVNQALSAAQSGPVVWAVQGSLHEYEPEVQLIKSCAAEQGIEVSALPALFATDSLLAAAGVTQAAQRIDASEIAAIVAAEPFSGGLVALDPTRSLIISGFDQADYPFAVRHALLRLYPGSHGLKVIRDLNDLASPVTESIIGDLDPETVGDTAAIIVPPLDWLEASRSPATLFRIIGQLRSPTGCPWDRKQTHVSLSDKVLEEAHEVADAIASGDADDLRDELGDLMLLVSLHAQIAEEAGEFTIEEVFSSVNEKLVRRHPHVFGDVVAETPDDVLSTWKRVKAAEQASTGAERPSLRYDQLPRSMSVIGRIRRSEENDEPESPNEAPDLGRRLLALVREGLNAGIDPERALEAAYRESKLGPPGAVE